MFNIVDEALKVTKPLPNGANTTYTDGIQVKDDTTKPFLAQCELLIEAPALAVGPLADAKTMKYSVQHDDDANFGSAVLLAADVLTQTGAGGAGAPAASFRFRLPTNVKKYIRVRAVGSTTGDASGSSMTASLRT